MATSKLAEVTAELASERRAAEHAVMLAPTAAELAERAERRQREFTERAARRAAEREFDRLFRLLDGGADRKATAAEHAAMAAEVGMSKAALEESLAIERESLRAERLAASAVRASERAATAARMKATAASGLPAATRAALTGKRGLIAYSGSGSDNGAVVATISAPNGQRGKLQDVGTIRAMEDGRYSISWPGKDTAVDAARIAVQKTSVVAQAAREQANGSGKRGDQKTATLREQDETNARAELHALTRTYDASEIAPAIAELLPVQRATVTLIGTKQRAELWAGATTHERAVAERAIRREIMTGGRALTASERVLLSRARKELAAGKLGNTSGSTAMAAARRMIQSEAMRASKRRNK